MSALTSEIDHLVPAVQALLSMRISSAAETVIRTAVEDFETRLRKEVAATAMEVSRFYELSTSQDRLVITVKLKS